jgi:UDP-N-acetylmuramoyl-tripeptide--D-alanyl-D-alanine ligase
MLTVAELAQSLRGAIVQGDGRARVTSVSTDSRTVNPGALFVALRGDRFDGHDYVASAVARGALAALVERPLAVTVPQVIVADSKRALGVAAAAWRARFSMPLIAVTGSNGKTTVTQMIATILTRAFGEKRRLATRGNLNNDIGLPLMLFELNGQHKVAVLELGMNHRGEIAYLAELAKPTVALVNNAQREHQEFLESVAATAHENGAAISALPPDGVAIFPADDACAGIWRDLAGTRRLLDFALSGFATLSAQYALTAGGSRIALATPAGAIDIALPVPGQHNVRNALAATAAALAVGVSTTDIAAALAGFKPPGGRGVRMALASGAALIDDTYNANPDSVRAAIDVLSVAPAPRVLVLGDMGEVGAQGPAFHEEIGAYARTRGIEELLCTGTATLATVAAFGARARHFSSIDELIDACRIAASAETTLLVKGSRFMRMERVVRALTQTSAGAH